MTTEERQKFMIELAMACCVFGPFSWEEETLYMRQVYLDRVEENLMPIIDKRLKEQADTIRFLENALREEKLH